MCPPEDFGGSRGRALFQNKMIRETELAWLLENVSLRFLVVQGDRRVGCPW